jgi:hypothetical protein
MDGLAHIAAALAGPLGGLLAALAIIGAVIRGDLRLKREIDAIAVALAEEKADRERWEKMALDQLMTTDRAIRVASVAVTQRGA